MEPPQTKNFKSERKALMESYAKGWCMLPNVTWFPYDKPRLQTIQEQQKIRRALIATGLWSLFYTIFVDLMVPQEIVNLIINYTIDFEIVDEIFDHFNFFYKDAFQNLIQGLWNKMVDAQLYRTIGWFPEPEPKWIRNKYFKQNGYAWRKTFDFPGTALTFAQCVVKRLYLIKNNIIYTYFVRTTVALNNGLGVFHSIKPCKRRTWDQHQIEMIRLLRMYRDRVHWINDVVSAICIEENKIEIAPGREERKKHENYPLPKSIL